MPFDLRGKTPESCRCIDCGINTWPGHLDRIEQERILNTHSVLHVANEPSVKSTITDACEIYTVRDKVWKAAGMTGYSGCLCIGCLEKRLGRRLEPRDFPRHDAFNRVPGTPRLLERRGDV
jgi:hypothetical protein